MNNLTDGEHRLAFAGISCSTMPSMGSPSLTFAVESSKPVDNKQLFSAVLIAASAVSLIMIVAGVIAYLKKRKPHSAQGVVKNP